MRLSLAKIVTVAAAVCAAPGWLAAQSAAQAAAAAGAPSHTPTLDVTAMDRSVDPCTDFYAYSCGGWMKRNPIPADQAGWGVYSKLHDDNLNFLHEVLEEAARPGPGRDTVSREIGDFYAACTNEAAIEAAGTAPLKADLDLIAGMRTLDDLAAVVAQLHLEAAGRPLFGFGSTQDYKDASQVIAEVSQGGLGLPDRDYYLKTDPKSVETRERYLAHLRKMLALAGESQEQAAADAQTVMRIETALAHGCLTRVEMRDPESVYHRMSGEQLAALDPAFPWKVFFARVGEPGVSSLNVAQPGFFKALDAELKAEDLASWKTYLRWHLIRARAGLLSPPFERESFDFYARYLRGTKEMQPRWKRCVSAVDRNLGEALGQAYVKKAFSPELKERTEKMVQEIEAAMERDIHGLTWMSDATRQQAIQKLHGLTNKVGYPEHWRDYSSIRLTRDDFAGDVARCASFETRRQLAKIGKPVDRGEWGMTPPTVNAYYNPLLNEINFPAGILQPPLFDPKMDDAPNFGDTGATIGHELTHGFDDQGRKFDAVGNLRDWWTAADGAEFDRRAKCISDQYSQYTVVDDVKINGKLTLGEDIADLGGTILAYAAWQDATRGQDLHPIEGFTPDQRFFIGYAQSWCSSQRPEDQRLRAATDPHSPPKYRANGVVTNMPEFAKAFSCRPGQPMAPEKICRVW